MPEDLNQIADDFVQGVKATHKFLSLPRATKVMAIKTALDKQVGDDPGAMYPTIPGIPLPPGLVEAMTDPLLDKLAEMVVDLLEGDA